jgi:hypothetical protein
MTTANAKTDQHGSLLGQRYDSLYETVEEITLNPISEPIDWEHETAMLAGAWIDGAFDGDEFDQIGTITH